MLLAYSGFLLGKKIYIEGISANLISHAENVSATPEKLAVNLLTVLFKHEELATGNCTRPKRDDICILDQTKIATRNKR